MTRAIRNGTGTKAYRRKAAQLKHRTQKNGGVCAWCGQPFDWDAHWTSPLAFTADHVEAIANGGDLLGELQALHRRSCNAQKGTRANPTIRAAS